jgi:hypothetical protein
MDIIVLVHITLEIYFILCYCVCVKGWEYVQPVYKTCHLDPAADLEISPSKFWQGGGTQCIMLDPNLTNCKSTCIPCMPEPV